MLASGTRNAREICGLSRGSAAQRLGDADLLAVDAGVGAALREPVGVGGVVDGVVTNRPPVSSMQSAATRRRIRFSPMHSSAARGSLTA